METTGGHFGGTMLRPRRVGGHLMRLILLEVMDWLFHELVYCLSLYETSFQTLYQLKSAKNALYSIFTYFTNDTRLFKDS